MKPNEFPETLVKACAIPGGPNGGIQVTKISIKNSIFLDYELDFVSMHTKPDI